MDELLRTGAGNRAEFAREQHGLRYVVAGQCSGEDTRQIIGKAPRGGDHGRTGQVQFPVQLLHQRRQSFGRGRVSWMQQLQRHGLDVEGDQTCKEGTDAFEVDKGLDAAKCQQGRRPLQHYPPDDQDR